MNVTLGKLNGWVKHGDYQTDVVVVREAVRRMKESQPSEPESLQRMMDEAEQSEFNRMTRKDWTHLRRLAKAGIAK